MDESARYLRVVFRESPVAGKSYRVGHYRWQGIYPPTDEVYVKAGQVNTHHIFKSNGDEGILATVRLLNGKRVITIPEFSASSRYDDRKTAIKVSVRDIMLEYR